MLHELALFAGGGGGILASHLLGIRTIGAVEINPAARAILHARQRDGYLPFFPVWDDIRTFNGTTEPGICRMAHGVANRVDRLQALGNGQVPAVAAKAFCALYTRLFPPLRSTGL